jgi:hypothetical protein
VANLPLLKHSVENGAKYMQKGVDDDYKQVRREHEAEGFAEAT